MDIMPLKLRSPPPKPPRRRHSDQLSVTSSGTFPSSKRKLAVESNCCNDIKQGVESSTSSCGSLPANWTLDFCQDDKAEKLPVFSEQDSTSKTIERNFKITSEIKDFLLECNKNKFVRKTIPDLKNNSKQLLIKKCETPCFHLIAKDELYSFDDLSKFFPLYLHKYNHRRHNSDPLPLNIKDHDFYPLSPLLSAGNQSAGTNPEVLCESKENQCLLQEIKSLKEINSKLWKHLCHVQASVDNLKKCPTEDASFPPVSDLLMSLYDSFKAKDAAMEERMKVVLQERDNAINDLDRMVQVLAKSFDGKYSNVGDKSSDEKIRELLNEIEVTSNPSKLLQQQRLLLSYLYKSKEMKLDQLLHDIKLLSVENDNLKLKVQRSDRELNRLKLSNEIWSSDNKLWESSLLNALGQVIQQRDMAVKTCNTNSMGHFNHRSLAFEKPFESKEINECLQRLEETCVQKKLLSFSQNEAKKYSPLSAKSKCDDIRYLKEEMLILSSSLESEVEKKKIAEEKCLRLEKLVNVLQKKLNGQNVGVPV